MFEFLDDVYALAEPDRVRTIYDLLELNLRNFAGIELNQGKTRLWNKSGVKPDGFDDLGDDVWSPCGVKVLGTPVGTDEFVQQHLDEKVTDEKKLWEALPEVPDLQCAWQVLVQCAGPRANHLLRTVPPSQSKVYAEAHDRGLWNAAQELLGGLPGSLEQKTTAAKLSTLPMRIGGLGLRSAV